MSNYFCIMLARSNSMLFNKMKFICFQNLLFEHFVMAYFYSKEICHEL
jgi:hypothetical protein